MKVFGGRVVCDLVCVLVCNQSFVYGVLECCDLPLNFWFEAVSGGDMLYGGGMDLVCT